jgi:WD40 repeat protein/tetratricopeptide (TPR) repeat protein
MRAGEKVRDYVVVGVLGKGGMGVTYEAERTTDGARVALKELHLSRVDDWKVVDLFEREARVLADITHPAVPRYIDHFSTEDANGPTYYLVQELARGQSLAQRVASGWRADEPEARRIAEALLDLLDYLHARMPPVFHRDIKPQNVILGDQGKVWLVDFGSVRDVYRTTAGGSTVAGTFGYMAAEQLRGIARPESDLYGVAATLLFALSGQSPAEMPQVKLRADFRSRVRVSPAFASWLEKMLEPAPEDRFASARLAIIGLRNPAAVKRPATTRKTTVVLAAILGVVGIAAAGVATIELLGDKATTRGRAATAATSPSPLPARPHDFRFPAIQFLRMIPAHFTMVHDAVFTPDGTRLLTGSFDATVKIWDARTGHALGALPGHTGRVAGVRITADGRNAVTAADRTVRVFGLPDGKLVRAIDAGPAPIISLALAPDGKSLVTGHADGQAKLWTVDGAPLLTVTHGGGRVLSATFTPDGSRFVTAGDNKIINVWDAADGKGLRALSGHTAAVGEVRVAPDGQTLASASDDHSVRLWNIENGRALRTLSLHTDEVWTVAFSPDGGTLLSGGKDAVLGVWSIPTAQLRQTYPLDDARKTLGLSFSADGGTFAAAYANGVVDLWKLQGGQSHVVLPDANPSPAPTPPSANPEVREYSEVMDLLDANEGDPRVFDAAEARLQKLLDANPRSALAYAGLGRVAFKRGHLHDAVYDPPLLAKAQELSSKAIALDPTLPDGYCVRGWAAQASKDDAGARTAAATALKLAPTMPRAALLSVSLDVADKDYTTAEQTIRRMLSRPLDARTIGSGFATLADIYEKMGEVDAADGARQREIAANSDSAWAKGNYASFLIRKGDYDAAIAMAKKALSQREYGMAKRTLAMAYCLNGEQLLWDKHDADGAARAFRDAEGADSRYSRAAYDQGAVHEYLGATRKSAKELDEAKTWYSKAAALDPSDDLPKRALAELGRH